MSTRSRALSLYHQLLRTGSQYKNYNFREYAVRKTRDSFRSNSGEGNPEVINKLLDEGERNLIMLQRQVSIGNAFAHDSIMNREFTKPRSRV